MDRSSQIVHQGTAREALARAFASLSPWSDPHRHEARFYGLVLAEILRACPKRPARIMDLGCGVGVLALALKFLGYEVDGAERHVFSDRESPMYAVSDIDGLKSKWRENEVRVYELDVVRGLPAELFGQYDVVVNTAVIEHVRSPKDFLTGIRDLLRQGGLSVTMTPNAAVFYKRLRFLLGKSPWWEIKEFYELGETGFTGHWREYTESELIWMHQAAGLVVDRALNKDIFPIFAKKSLRNLVQLLIRYVSYFVPQSREAHIIVARKV